MNVHTLEQEPGHIIEQHLLSWTPPAIEGEIPHGDMQNRDFVLRPLAQIAPYVQHPILKKTVGGMLADLEHSQKI